MPEIVKNIITGLVALLAGGSGVFVYLNNKEKNKIAVHSSSVSEWKELYDEMKARLDEQEKENEQLRNEIFELKKIVNELSIELSNYKTYDVYINDLEKYIDHLLHTSKSLLTEDAYRNICNKRPVRKDIYEEG